MRNPFASQQVCKLASLISSTCRLVNLPTVVLIGLLISMGFWALSGVEPLAALQEASCVQLAQHTTNPVERAVFTFIHTTLQASPSTKDLLCQALRDGFNKTRITPERALSLLQRINQSTAPLEQREGVLMIIAQTLLMDLPVEMIVSKIEEGMAKGVPMSEILKEISERMLALREVRDFLFLRGIRPGAEVPGTSLKLTLAIVDIVITDITGALEDDLIRKAKNPEQAAQDASAVKAAVLNRLELDQRVPRELFSFIAKQINDPTSGWLSGLVQIAMNIAARIKK